MKNKSKFPKKLISVFLTVLMLLTSMSCMFTAFAAITADTLTELSNALKSNTVKNLSASTSFNSVKDGKGTVISKLKSVTNTTTITLKTYAEYQEMLKILTLLDKAIDETTEFTKWKNFNSNDNRNVRNCSNFLTLSDEIAKSLQEDRYMGTAGYAEYNVASFFSNVFSMANVSYYHTNDECKREPTASNYKVPEKVSSVTVIKTDDYKGYLATLKSRDEVPANVELGSTLTLAMDRVTFKNAVVQNYHNAFNDKNVKAKTFVVGTTKNSNVKTTLNAYDTYLNSVAARDLTYEKMLDMLKANTLSAFEKEFTDKYNAIVSFVGGVNVFNKLYSDRLEFIDQTFKTIASAKSLEEYLLVAEDYMAFVTAKPEYGIYNYGGFDYDTMMADYNEFLVVYSKLLAGGDELIEYLASDGTIDIDYAINFEDNVKVYDLYNIGEKVNALYNNNIEIYETLSIEEQNAIYSSLVGYINVINTYSVQVQNSIFPEGTAYLVDFSEKLQCAINDYVVFFTENTKELAANKPTNNIIDLIAAIPENLDGLDAFYEKLSQATSADRANELIGELRTAAHSLEEDLYKALALRFTDEVNRSYELYVALGSPEKIDLRTASKLGIAFKGLEDEILTYLEESEKAHFISEETIELYNWLLDVIYSKYTEYMSTYGLNDYERTDIEYAPREVYPNDVLKTEAYEVTEEKLSAIITKIDTLITGQQFKELTKSEGIDAKLKGLLDKIYTDDVINAIVQYIYPVVVNMFVDTWDNLPTSIVVTVPDAAGSLDADVEAGLELKTLEEAMKETGLYIAPGTLAELIADEYPEAAQTLSKCTTKATLVTNPWTDENICDENGKLDLVWNVTDRESFVKAFSAALSGVEPIFMALLANKPMELLGNIGTGFGTATVLGLRLDLNLTEILLTFTGTPCSGYNNGLAPIFEALGLTVPNGDNFTGLADFIDNGVLDPVYEFIDKLSAAPLDTVLSILPHLVYGLITDMLPALLNEISSFLSYVADANYVVGRNLIHKEGVAKAVMKKKVPAEVNIGKIVDFGKLGIDPSDVNGLLAKFGFNLPELDTVTIATLGELTTVDTVRTHAIYDRSSIGSDKAYAIKSDKTDLGYYFLTYVIDLIQDKDAFSDLLSSLLDAEAAEKITTLISSLNITSTGDAIAAITELLNAEKYEEATFTYPEASETEGTVIDKEVFYSVYWTEEKAKYTADNLLPFVDNICNLLGFDIAGKISDVVTSLYTAENVKKLTSLVNGMLDKLLANEKIMKIIETVDPLISINITDILSHLKDYKVPEFESGDEKAFVTAIVNYVSPLVPVLKLFLLSDSGIEIADGLVNVFGYNGYDSAVIPILEAIGCKPEDITSYEEFSVLSDEEMVYAVISPVLSLVNNTIADDPINNIIALLPNILYFIDFGGLNMAVNNLLRPVYALLDTVRPIYDLDITVNLNLNEIITDILAKANIKSISYTDISNIVKMIGKETVYTSATGNEAVKLSVEYALTPEFITAILRKLVRVFVFSDNSDSTIDWIQNNTDVSDTAKDDVEKIIKSWSKTDGPDQVLFVLFYTFYGLSHGAQGAVEIRDLVSDELLNAFKAIGFSSSNELKDYVDQAKDIILNFTSSMEEIFGNDSKNENSITSFFERIINFFKNIINFILNLFRVK